MKYFRIMTGLILLTAVLFSNCKKDEFPVPEASSQAEFSMNQSIIEILNDQNETVKVFQLELINESVFAQTFEWFIVSLDAETLAPVDTVFHSIDENPEAIVEYDGSYNITLKITTNIDVHYNNLEVTKRVRLLFKETLFLETFDGPADGEDDTWLPDGWAAIDADGDGINWYWSPGDGNGQMRSQSWDGVPLEVDNWLVTKEIDLSNVLNDDIVLSFHVRPAANTPTYRQEHYGIFVSTVGPELADFPSEPNWNEKLTPDMPNNVFQYREVDLTSFQGETIWIAIRHYESSDNDRIVFDDLEVFKKF